MAKLPDGCARPVSTVQTPEPQDAGAPAEAAPAKEHTMTATVGQKAPDFTAPAYFKGGFTSVRLSDHFGKWILLCFYPGDFTFV